MDDLESRVEMPPGMSKDSSETGVGLARLVMRPERPPRSGVMIVHGLGEHIARYIPLASMLVEGGCVVTGVDFPGHGRSPGVRGDVGTWEAVKEVFDASVSWLRNEVGVDAPLGLVAHSMGGLLALRYLEVRPEVFSQVWLSSPLLRPRGKVAPWSRPLVRALAAVVPAMTLNSGVRTKQCRVVPDGESTDPHFHKRVTVGWGVELWRIEKQVWADLDRLRPDLQILITQGSKDEICPQEHARDLFERLGVDEKQYELLEGELHEPLFGPQAAMVEDLVKRWFESRGLIEFP